MDFNNYLADAVYLKLARNVLGLTRKEIALELGVKERTYQSWELDKLPKSGNVDRAMKKLDELLGDRKEDILRVVNEIKSDTQSDTEVKHATRMPTMRKN